MCLFIIDKRCGDGSLGKKGRFYSFSSVDIDLHDARKTKNGFTLNT